MKYEGHFLLWYFILMPFAKLGFPYVTTNIISWIITSVSVYLILKKAPFKFYKRVLIVFSFQLIYLFPVISRCYCLIPLAIVLMCLGYKDRKEKPLNFLLPVVMLVNTHVIMLGMVGIVLLEYFWEFLKDFKTLSSTDRNKRFLCLVLAGILIILSGLPLVGSLSTNQTLGVNRKIEFNDFLTLLTYPWRLISTLYSSFRLSDFLMICIDCIIVVLLILEVKNSPFMYLKLFICIMWQCVLYVFIYGHNDQRVGAILLIILYFKWINSFGQKKPIKILEKRTIDFLWAVLASFSIIHGLLFLADKEMYINYSSGIEMAQYMNENLSDGSIVLNGPFVEYTTSIMPYLKKDIKFYSVMDNRYFSFAIWNDENTALIDLSSIERISKEFPESQKLYYIIWYTWYNKIYEKSIIQECVDKGFFEELYQTSGSCINEDFK